MVYLKYVDSSYKANDLSSSEVEGSSLMLWAVRVVNFALTDSKDLKLSLLRYGPRLTSRLSISVKENFSDLVGFIPEPFEIEFLVENLALI